MELRQSKEQFLKEKVACAKASGELKALRSRLAEATDQAEALQSQLSSERRQSLRTKREEEARLQRKCQHLEVELQVI